MKYFLLVIPTVFLWIVFDVVRALLRKKIPDLPNPDNNTHEGEILTRLATDAPIDDIDEKLEDTFRYINSRYDCADFKLHTLLRIYLQFGDKLPLETKAQIRETILNFKYWMDQPGKDSMCYWSENHQILFSSAEYLAGQTFPDDIFSNDGKNGREHMKLAAARIEDWMCLRFQYGFSEWYSNVYYVEDLAAMSNLAEFTKDQNQKIRMYMIIDLFWFDIASHSLKGAFVSTSGRMYARHRMSSDKGNSLRDAITWLWPEYPVGDIRNIHGMLNNFILNKEYKLPEAIRNIMTDENPQIILASNGINVNEMKAEGLLGQEGKQIMMQFGKEAFTSPELIANTEKYLVKTKMFNNMFMNPLGFINISFLKLFHLLAPMSRMLKSPSDTVALNRANVYAYRTKDYIMATAQQYGTDTCAFQQHIFSATLHQSLSLFTSWPSKLSDGGSPSFFIGSFRLPHAFQYKNTAIMIYNLDIKKHFAEKKPLEFTHAYFPTEFMDEHIIDKSYAFCRKGDTYAAVIGSGDLTFGAMRENKIGNYDLTKPYELRQYGSKQFWIFELSSLSEDGSFENFIKRVKSNPVKFENEGNNLSYETRGDKITVLYKQKAVVNGQDANTSYRRFDSAYSVTERKAEEITLSCGGAKLTLNPGKLIRREDFDR